ncbi:MAG: hypothetical protein K8S18_16760 [Desulfobacula sp.]|nr:hypothetical protein [Desulfobacula sp.]
MAGFLPTVLVFLALFGIAALFRRSDEQKIKGVIRNPSNIKNAVRTAYNLKEKKKDDEAYVLLKEIKYTKVDLHVIQAKFLLGLLQIKFKKYSEAETSFMTIIQNPRFLNKETDINYAGSYFYLGAIKYKNGELELAKKYKYKAMSFKCLNNLDPDGFEGYSEI